MLHGLASSSIVFCIRTRLHKAEGGDGGVRWTGRGTRKRRGERAAHGNRGRHLSGTINSKHATRAYTVLQCSMYKWHRVLTKAALARSFRRPPTHINLNQVCSHVIAEGITTTRSAVASTYRRISVRNRPRAQSVRHHRRPRT